MTKPAFFKVRLYFTATVTIAFWLLLIWDHFHGGVPSHHILHQKDMPSFSNWWGGLLIPVLTWFLTWRMQQRMTDDPKDSKVPVQMLYAFIGAFFWGILLSMFFTLEYTEIPFYMLVGLIMTALFLPIYQAEYFLGFVLGMVFTFGGVLPIGIISILTLIGAVQYLVVRRGVLFVASKLAK